jgi:hypothetical protein
MPTVVTGRTRTLEFTGDIESLAASNWICLEGEATPDSSAGFQFVIAALGAELIGNPTSGGAVPIDCTPTPAPYATQVRARVVGIPVGEVGDVMDTGTVTYNEGWYTRPGSFELDYEGSYSFSLPVEEVAFYDDLINLDAALCDANGFPREPILNVSGQVVGYGSAHPDGLRAKAALFYERAVIGEQMVATLTLNGHTATAFVTITAFNQFDLVKTFGSGIDYGLRIVGTTGAGNRGNSLYISANFQGGALSAPWSTSKFDASATALPDGLTVTTMSGSFLGTYSTGEVALFPALKIDVSTRARKWLDSYGGGLSVRTIRDAGLNTVLTSVGGGPSIEMRRYGCAADLNGTPGTGAFANEWGYTRSWLDAGTLSSAGEDVRGWRLQYRGKRWPAIDLTRDSSVTIDDGSSAANWTAGENTTVTSSAGAINIAASGGSGSATRTYSPDLMIGPFRYLRARAKGTGTITVTIQGKAWEFAPTASFADYDLDLACEQNETAEVEPRDSRFPIENPGGFPTATLPQTPYSMGWGVTHTPSIEISGVPDGSTLEIDSMQLVALDGSRFDLQGPFAQFGPGWTSPSDTTTLRPWLHLTRDGLVSDLPDMALVTPTSGTPSYTWFSISQAASMVSHFPGYSATALPALPDGFHGPALEMHHLGGGGALYAYATQTWTDQLARTDATIDAQMLWDVIDIYPGAGRGVWDGSNTYGAIPVAASKQFRGRAEGIVFSSDSTPLPGATVAAFEVLAPLVVAGSELSASDGAYRTLAPYGRGNVDHRTELRYGPLPYLFSDQRWQNRGRYRTSFRVGEITESGEMHMWSRSDGPTYTLVAGDDLVLRRDWLGSVATWTLLSSPVQSAQGAWHPQGRILIAYVLDGDADVLFTESAGNETEFDAAMSVATGTRVALAVDPKTGFTALAAYDSDRWKLYVRGLSGVFEPAGDILIADEDAGALEFDASPLRLLRFATIVGGSIEMRVSPNYGQTWEAV